MEYKKFFFIIIIICILLSLSSVYASEKSINQTQNEFDDVTISEDIELNINEISLNDHSNNLNNNFQNLSEKCNEEVIGKSQNDILSQYHDDELSGSLIKTKMSVSNYSVTLNPTSKSFIISKLSAKVQTTSGKSINKGGVYFEIFKNSYDKIKTYGVEVENGVSTYTHGLEVYLSPGKYKCIAYFSDYSETYESSSCIFYLTVKAKTELTVNDIKCNIGEYIKISSSLKSGTGHDATRYGNIIFSIDSKKYVTSGSVSLNMNTAGKLKCTAQYIGTSYYLNSTEKTFYITVSDTTKVVYSLESTNVLAGDKIKGEYRVVDGFGNIVTRGNVKITEATMLLIVTAYYDKLPSYSTKGHLSITAPNKPGKYTYGIYYSGKNTDFQGSSSEFNINVYSISKISSDVIKTNLGKTTNIKITVKDHLGQNIDEGIVKSTINGKTYIANVKNGIAIFNNVKMPLNANTYYYTVTYSTDSGLYTTSSSVIKIICSHESKIKVKSISGYSGKKVKLTATVKDGLGNKIKKGTIKFKINGKTYKAKVKNGKATKKIKLPKAKVSNRVTKTSGTKRTVTTYFRTTYLCTALFSGYKQYPSSSSNFKITSKKKPITKKYYIAKSSSKKKTSYKSKSKNVDADILLRQDYYTFWFNYNGHTLGSIPVTYKIYTGSQYNEYQSQTDSLGFVDIYPIPKGTHKIYIEGQYLLDTKKYHSTFTVYRC